MFGRHTVCAEGFTNNQPITIGRETYWNSEAKGSLGNTCHPQERGIFGTIQFVVTEEAEMAKWSLTGVIRAGKYLGEVEADTEAEAIEKGWQLESCSVSMCHQCADECEDPEISEIVASKV